MAPPDRDAIRLADPDPLGLVDVIELIAPGARVTGWQPLPGVVGNGMHAIEVTMPSGAGTSFVLRRAVPETGRPTDLRHAARTLELRRSTPVPASMLIDVDPSTAPVSPPDAAAIRDLLTGGLPSLGQPTMSLCHGDFHVGNVLLDGGRVAGIVDWDHARIGDARADLAYAAMDLAIVAGGEVADAFVAEYEALRGPVEDLHWWCLWATTRTWHGLASWLPGWTEIAVDVDLASAEARLADWTHRHRRALATG